jgi:cytidylate kinase
MASRKLADASLRRPGQAVAPPASIGSKAAVLQHAANELVFAVVGHVGSGTSTIANVLAELLGSSSLPGGAYEVEVLRARNEIEEWAKSAGRTMPATKRTDLTTTVTFQDLGDEMRLSTKDNSAVARALIRRVRRTRAEKIGR